MPIVQIGRQVLVEVCAALVLGAIISSGIVLWLATEFFQGDFAAMVILVGVYLLATIAYATGASLYFKPKQLISPTLIQIITIPIVAILVVDFNLRRPAFILPAQNWAVFVAFYGVELGAITAFLLAISYYALSPITRYLVGLIGTKEDLVCSQLLVHAPINRILATFADADFQYAFGIDQQEEVRADLWVFRSKPTDLGGQTVDVVCPNPTDRKTTQLVLVSYELARFGIYPTSRTNMAHEIDVQTIKNRFRGFKIEDDKKLGKTKLLPALTIAYESSLACTEPKILAIKRLPTKHKVVMVVTALFLFAVGVLGWYNIITPDTATSGIVFTGIALIFELIPLLTLKRGSRVV